MNADLIDRVRQIIGSTGENQTAFAERIGIATDKLSKSLNGVRNFTSLELALIAEAGETTVDWLLSGRQSRTAIGVAARKFLDCEHSTPDVRATLDRYEQIIDGLARIDYKLSMPSLPDIPSAGRLVDQGSILAQTATGKLQDAPADCSTKELAELSEVAFGIEIASVKLPDGIDGLSWTTPDFRLILVAKTDVWTRQRFTLAHEIGHILARDADDDFVAESVLPGSSTAAREVRANAFAAEFLMPAEALRSDISGGAVTKDMLIKLAWRYKVSPSAMAVRLKVLNSLGGQQQREWGIITTADCARAAGAIKEHVFSARDAEQGWFPRRLTELAIQAYVAGDISVRPLASLLCVPADDLLDILEPPAEESAQTVAAPDNEEFSFVP